MKEPELTYAIEEKNNEDLIIIKEGYQSSPKCGIKCKIVKNVLKNIIFTPVEISAQPYLKYSVTQIIEEKNNDISPTETENTKLQEEKSRTYNLSTTNNDEFKLSQIKDKKTEGNSAIYDEANNKHEKENENNNIHIVEKKESEKTFSLSKDFDEKEQKIDKEKEIKDKNKKKNKNYFNTANQTQKIYHHSLKDKDNDKLKIKLNLNNKEDEKKKKQFKNSQRNIYSVLNNISYKESNHSSKANNDNLLKTEEKKDSNKTKSIFNFNSIIKKNSPIIIKYKRDSMKVRTSITSTNVKQLKKAKKGQDFDTKKLKKHIIRQHSHIPMFIFKKMKNIQNDEKEKDNKKTRRRTLVPKEDNKKENNKSFNILNNDKDKDNNKDNTKLKLYIPKSKHIKMKSLENTNDNKNQILNIENNNNKKNENEITWTPKRNVNYSYKLKKEKSINYGDENNNQNNNNSTKNHVIIKTIKGSRRVSFFKENKLDSKKKRKLFTEEKKDESTGNKEKYIFSVLKEKDKEKEKSYIKDKKLDKKLKKKIKEKKSKKEKEKEKDKDNCNNNGKNGPNKKIIRKDKSFTIVSKLKKKLINEDNPNINKNKLKFNKNNSSDSSKSNKEKNGLNVKKTKKKPSSSKVNNKEPSENNHSDVRRNSTRDLFRENNSKEKITALTNKQIIDNINDYTRQCLQIIPDLYELQEKMPRCKAKIHPNLSGNKKIALFDLDETIVHCIGEINMNNVESFSLQSDAKIRVHLPGGKREVTIGINIRPHWEEALNKIKNKYHIIAFTASHESYADSVLNHLDPEGKYFEFRLYRCHCVLCIVNGMKFYVKDLKIIEDLYDLKDVVIIDNSVLSFAYHLDNGIPISPFYDSKNDNELLDIADFLVKYAKENDIRDKLKEIYKLSQYMEILKEYNSEEDEESSNNVENEEEKDEKNNLSTGNKNRTNINLIKPLLVNNINININKENSEAKPNKSKDKNISQINLKLKEIKNMFNVENKDKVSTRHFKNTLKKSKKSVSKYLETTDKNINGNKRKEKHKTILLGINFQKEWEEKQKELKNN